MFAESHIVLMLLGFAKVAGYPDWPVRVTSEAGASRLKVSFLGTTRESIIVKTAFSSYTASHLRRISTPSNLRRGALKAGLQEIQKLSKPEEKVDPDKPEKKEKKKSSEKSKGLRKEKEENDRKFGNTMVKNFGRRVWSCRRCIFKTGLRFKARNHALTCNSMVRKRRRRVVGLSCMLCPQLPKFSCKIELNKHGLESRVIFILTLFTNHLWAVSKVVQLKTLISKRLWFLDLDYFSGEGTI